MLCPYECSVLYAIENRYKKYLIVINVEEQASTPYPAGSPLGVALLAE
jgi:hypothetical protein